jgi:hypothetical protein
VKKAGVPPEISTLFSERYTLKWGLSKFLPGVSDPIPNLEVKAEISCKNDGERDVISNPLLIGWITTLHTAK